MARKEKPTGQEIAKKAKKAKLEPKRALQAKRYGKRVKFTPANLDHVAKINELDDGVILGELETELEKEETGIPPGKHNLLLAGLETGWQIYAESGGEIIGKAAQVRLELYPQGSRLPDESYIELGSPLAVCTILGIAGLVVGIFGLFRWW